MVEPWNWTCPFCSRPQTVTENGKVYNQVFYQPVSKYGRVGTKTLVVTCSNPECLEMMVDVVVCPVSIRAGEVEVGPSVLFPVGNVPSTSFIKQPEYVPEVLREDYYEACSIEGLSPKASATLLRRCLQGMIRDFCNISKPRLIDEIRELRRQVDAGHAPKGVIADVLDAIDGVREIGNIGAHMERDINVIVEIDPGEARVLRELVELLFKEWYVARHDRSERIAKIGALQAAKAAQKALPAPQIDP